MSWILPSAEEVLPALKRLLPKAESEKKRRYWRNPEKFRAYELKRYYANLEANRTAARERMRRLWARRRAAA